MLTTIKNTFLYRPIGICEQMAEYGLWITVFFLPISMAVSSTALLCSAVFLLAGMGIRRNFEFQRTPLDTLIAGFVIMSALSVLKSPDKVFSFYNFYHLVGLYVLGYYVMVNTLRDVTQIKRLFCVLFVSAIVVTAYGFYQYLYGLDITSYEWVDDGQFPELKKRIFSTMKNPNLFAGYLVTVISMGIGLLFGDCTRKSRLTVCCIIMLLFGAVLLTFSRSAWLSLVGIFFALGFFKNKKIFYGLLALPLVIAISPDLIMERFTSILNPVDTSSNLRIALWESTCWMILHNPLMGIGWGIYWKVYPAFDFYLQDPSTTIYHAHNLYLHIAAEIGLIGFGFFIAMLWKFSKLMLETYRQAKSYWIKQTALALMTAFCGLLLNGLTDYIMFNIQMSMLFWLLLGWGIALLHSSQQNGG